MDIQLTRLRIMTEARSVARRLGLIKPLRKAIQLARGLRGNAQYEEKFDEALCRAIRPGDVVMDVGANLGLYSKKFLQLTGPSGTVYSMEPVPSCFAVLEKECSPFKNSIRFPLALGKEEAVVAMDLANDPLGATHTLVNSATPKGSAIEVRVARGDSLIREKQLLCPNVIKIDVEGFEEEVLLGLSETLDNPACRAVLIEVHFSLLEAKGEKQAPSRIQKFLEQKSFSVVWTDSSHLCATKHSK